MRQQYLKQLTPSVESYSEDGGTSSGTSGTNISITTKAIPGIDVMEVTPMSSSMIAKHAGEDGKVFADTRIMKPAQYRAIIAFPESDGVIEDVHKNLLDASYSPMQKYALTSYFTKCWDMVVVSSRNTDKPNMQGLRLQEVVFEECLKYQESNKYTLSDVKSSEDSKTQSQPTQNANG